MPFERLLVQQLAALAIGMRTPGGAVSNNSPFASKPASKAPATPVTTNNNRYNTLEAERNGAVVSPRSSNYTKSSSSTPATSPSPTLRNDATPERRRTTEKGKSKGSRRVRMRKEQRDDTSKHTSRHSPSRQSSRTPIRRRTSRTDLAAGKEKPAPLPSHARRASALAELMLRFVLRIFMSILVVFSS